MCHPSAPACPATRRRLAQPFARPASPSLVPRSGSAMESNKDEAERCISIALKAIQSNQPERALRFLEKAQRLYPTPRASGKWEEPQGQRGTLARMGGTRERTDGSSWRRGGGAVRRGYACALVRAGAAGIRSSAVSSLCGPLDPWRPPKAWLSNLPSACGTLWNMRFLGRRHTGRPGEVNSRERESELLFPGGCSMAQGQWPAWEIL